MRAAVVVLALVWPATLAGQQVERFTLSGDSIAIYNLAGQVTVEPGQGSVAVQVTRGGSGAARLRIVQGEIDDRETLRVLYPDDHIVYRGPDRESSTQLRVRDDGTFGDGDHYHDRHDSDWGRRVRISGSGAGLEAHADLRIQLPAGRGLDVYLAVGKVSLTNLSGRLAVDAHSAPVSATGIRGDLSIDVGSGNVRVSDVDGDLSIDTGSGPVEVSKFKGTTLSVDTGSGEVTGTSLEANEVSIDTGSGDIRLTSVTAPRLDFETGSGGVTADLRGPLRSLNVETGSGDVAITAPASLGAEVEIETSSGGVETDFPLEVTRHASDHLVGRIGNGQGRIAIETGSGEVRLIKSSN
jgi:lia operon protein LiaG